MRNLDDGILREGAHAVMNRVAVGNQGMHQRAITACALALNQNPETEQWLDWLFEPQTGPYPWRGSGGGIPGHLLGGMDRDGMGPEAAPVYALSWSKNLRLVAEWISDYGKYTRNDIFRDYPHFAAAITAPWASVVMGYATPNIGDDGACGLIRRSCSPVEIAHGYNYVQNPQIALAAYYANDATVEALGRDIYAVDPEATGREIAQVAVDAQQQSKNPFAGGRNRTGYGLASLEFGWGQTGIALWMYYGRTIYHGHADRLNWDILYRGLCMMPDHGHPEDTGSWPQRIYVTHNTVAHNTVVVNGVEQKASWDGRPDLYAISDDFGAVRVDSPEV